MQVVNDAALRLLIVQGIINGSDTHYTGVLYDAYTHNRLNAYTTRCIQPNTIYVKSGYGTLSISYPFLCSYIQLSQNKKIKSKAYTRMILWDELYILQEYVILTYTYHINVDVIPVFFVVVNGYIIKYTACTGKGASP